MENKTKKTYRVVTSFPRTQYWEYEVEAGSKEEAEEIVMEGGVEPFNHWTTEDGWENETVNEVVEVSEEDRETDLF